MNSSPIHESLVRAQLEPTLSPWKLAGARIRQSFNDPDEITMRLVTDEPTADASTLLGRDITLTLTRRSSQQEWSGVVESVEEGTSDRQLIQATVTVVSALVSLRHRTNCRVFQDLTVPAIIEEVSSATLGAFGRTVDTSRLSHVYDPVEYAVQYNETDFDFVHRLMEEHGINYHVECLGGRDVVVLSDTDAVFVDFVSDGYADGVLYHATTIDTAGLREELTAFERKVQRRSTAAATTVFDWLAPEEILVAESHRATEFDGVNGAALPTVLEDFRAEEPATALGYRSRLASASAVDATVTRRRMVQQRDAVLCSGRSSAVGLAPATRFELLEHPQSDLDGRYRVVRVEHLFGSFADETTAEPRYTNRFECIPEAFTWVPSRRRPHPRIVGLQTAIVVGPPGEEIHTDEHGRIKVQFHWDRQGRHDENSTCFLRVIQPWAGPGWGVVALPRVGMEVAVAFLDGDPDRPIIQGTLYNGAHHPPYPLPDERTKSTIRSQSTPGGGGYNEVRFEDAAGAEEIFVRAQRDYGELVLNDHDTKVGRHQTNTVSGDQTQTIHGNQRESIDGHQEVSVHQDRTVTVAGNFSETIQGTETRSVSAARSESLGADETRTIAGNQSETISGNAERTVSGSVTHVVSGAWSDTISGNVSRTVTGTVSITTPDAYSVTAAGGITMTAAAGITMIAPGGFTVLAPGGTTTIDSYFEKHGGMSLDVFAFKLAIYAAKVELDALQLTIAATKIDLIGVKVDISAFAYRNEPMSLSQLGSYIQIGLMHLQIPSIYMVM